jgi:site-specific DNA recombinase
MIRAIGYIRVSTAGQADHGVSLDAQDAKIRAMAIVHGAELVEIISDAGESAKDLARSGVERLLRLVNAKACDMVILSRLDRLTRSVKDLAEMLELFNKRSVSLVSVAEALDTGSASGRMILNIMTAVSQFEREAIAERTRTALQYKKAIGERVGNVAYGWKVAADGKRLEPDMDEQRMVSLIRELRSKRMSLREIAAELNNRGLATRKRGVWRHDYIASIVKGFKVTKAA